MKTAYTLAALLVMTTAGAACAHDMATGANGGQVVDSHGHHLELVAKDGSISIYLTDEKDQPIASKGASGRVIIQDSAATAPIELAPVDPNILTAKTPSALTAGTKLVVSAKLSDGHDVQGRFVAK